jgi:Zn-dependent protease
MSNSERTISRPPSLRIRQLCKGVDSFKDLGTILILCFLWSLMWLAYLVAKPLEFVLRCVPEEIPAGSLFGVEIKIHFTLVGLAIIMAIPFGKETLSHAAWLFLSYIIFILGVVTMHEFAHILVAKSYGYRTAKVLLTPIGGAAIMEQAPGVRAEFFITIAGPLSNFVLAAVLLPWADLDSTVGTKGWLATYVAMGSLFMGMFNMAPFFPMDGGRVLRCILCTFLSYWRATRTTCLVAWVGTPLFMFWGWANGFYSILIIGPLMCLLARAEFRRVKELEPIQVAEIRVEPVAI